MIDLSQWRASIGHWDGAMSLKRQTNPRIDRTQFKLTLCFIIIFFILLILAVLQRIGSCYTTGVIGYCQIVPYSNNGTRWVWSLFSTMTDCLWDCVNVHIVMSFLLLLSGDVEINPGPKGNSSELLRTHFDTLTDTIALNVLKITSGLYAKRLIPEETVEEILVMGVTTNYSKAMKLMFVVQQQLKVRFTSSPDTADQYLTDICTILINQQHQPLTDIATSLLRQLGQSIPPAPPISAVPTDVQRYSDILRERYKNQPIVAIDWPPRVGNDFFGRLVLIETQNSFQQHDTAWYMLRGKVDKIPNLPGCEKITVEQMLESCISLRVVVDGPPGIGKTTLCHKLCNMWANETLSQYDLVLYCPLRNSKIAQATTLADLYVYKCLEIETVTKWIEQSHGEGLLIIFDGWDELSTELRHSSLAASIIRREQLTKCSVIITSRSYASSSLLKLNSKKHVQVIGFLKYEIAKVVIGTFKDKDLQLAKKLVNDLEVRDDVQSLCYIPLVCSMVILVYCKLKGHLPTTLTKLYENFILQTIRRHVEKNQQRISIEPTLLDSLCTLPSELDIAFKEVCFLAYTNLIKPRMTFTYQQLQESLKRAVNEDYLGLLTSFNEHDEKVYQFLHLSIQEFLAAWWLVKSDMKTAEVFKEHINDDHFKLCLRFMAGLTHLKPEENYQQYFNKPLDLQCKRKLLSGFDNFHHSLFYKKFDVLKNPRITCSYVDPLKFLLHLLYESENPKLCQVFAESFVNLSFCFPRRDLYCHPFDLLCLNYFINFSNITWNYLHVHNLHDYLWFPFQKKLTANDIRIKMFEANFGLFQMQTPIYHSKFFQQTLVLLRTIQECKLDIMSVHNCGLVFCDLLSLPHLKALELKIVTCQCVSIDNSQMFKMKEALKVNNLLTELKLNLEGRTQILTTFIVSIIEGLTKNSTITSFTLRADVFKKICPFSRHSLPFFTLPDGLIEHLLKDNYTIQALVLKIPEDLLPSSLNIAEVNTPLSALNLSSLFAESFKTVDNQLSLLLSSILAHIKGRLHCLTLHDSPSYSMSQLFHCHHNLQSLALVLKATESVTELFTILLTNTTLKGLRVRILFDTESLGPILQDMLVQNQTLQYLEIKTEFHDCKFPPSTSYMAHLITGLTHNNTLQELRVPICLTPETDVFDAFFNIVSTKNNITELGIDIFSSGIDLPVKPKFDYEDKNDWIIFLFSKLLQSHSNMRQLWIEYPCFKLSSIRPLLATIYCHPSLEYVKIKRTGIKFDDFSKERLIALHKLHQPLKPLPVVEIT